MTDTCGTHGGEGDRDVRGAEHGGQRQAWRAEIEPGFPVDAKSERARKDALLRVNGVEQEDNAEEEIVHVPAGCQLKEPTRLIDNDGKAEGQGEYELIVHPQLGDRL